MNLKSDIRNCVVCSGEYHLDVHDVLCCSDCGLMNSGQVAGFGNPIQGMVKIAHRNYAFVAKAIQRAMPLSGAKILDVGCADGGFTELMIANGADSLGLEPDKVAGKEALDKKLPLELTSFENFSCLEKQYDAIVFNDVFEHMQNPNQVLEKSNTLLKDQGYILVNIPFSSGLIFRLVKAAARIGIGSPYRRIWARGLSSPHVYFYNEKNLTYLFENHKFELVDKGPLVSLAADGMYQRVRSTYGPIMALTISAVAIIFISVSKFFPADVNYLLFKKIHE